MASLSIIVPVFNEAQNIPVLLAELRKYCPPGTSFLFVDDGSTDETFQVIETAAKTDKQVQCISFSRNFGHQNALMAGMQACKTDRAIIMDGDLQHPPSLIPQILEKLDAGYDLVQTKRLATEKIAGGKKLLSRYFYGFINSISDTRIEPNVADFKGFTRKVLDSVLQFKERELFLRGIFSWIGFKTITLPFEAPPRLHGVTKYSYTKMMRLALKGTTSFSFKPLRIALFTGTLISLFAFGFALFALLAYFKGNTVPGWASMIIAIMFLGGTQLLAIGLMGEYIASLFTETKQRPLFLIDKTINT
ncbi:MAG: glycosyltransferase [Ferruginibacter sp.]|nr:glycosyltransferase [Ferruginibacter sp.]